jgi:L,D-peptidoglycan transpeptidase YkuD (ErfK/YbiS/YcfS/YnhG family)
MRCAVLSPEGGLFFGGTRFRAVWGAGGVRRDKREGDGGTPCAFLSLREVLYRADRLAAPRTLAPCRPLVAGEGWCDDPADPAYNQPVALPHPARHEILWREDGLYDVIGVLGWNDVLPVPGRGSAIFLHPAAPDFTPTAGCIALERADLLTLLARGLEAIAVLPPASVP